MSRELEVVSEFLAAETAGSENVTVSFDATTQGSLHVNSIRITSNTHCHVIDVYQDVLLKTMSYTSMTR